MDYHCDSLCLSPHHAHSLIFFHSFWLMTSAQKKSPGNRNLRTKVAQRNSSLVSPLFLGADHKKITGPMLYVRLSIRRESSPEPGRRMLHRKAIRNAHADIPSWGFYTQSIMGSVQ